MVSISCRVKVSFLNILLCANILMNLLSKSGLLEGFHRVISFYQARDVLFFLSVIASPSILLLPNSVTPPLF